MIISMIAAMGKNRVIGKDNEMMWHIPSEFKYFKETTLGHCIITGRKNFEATGRPLPGRTNIIVTRNHDYKAEGCVIVLSLEAALEYAKKTGEDEAFILGGGQLYTLGLEYCDNIYLTEVDYNEPGDVYFPEFDLDKYEKKLIKHQEVGEKTPLKWDAYLYTRN